MSSKYKSALEDMVWQFAYEANGDDKRPATIFTGGLSALEHAFEVLGYNDPHPVPEKECYVLDCHRVCGAGIPSAGKNGQYMWLCDHHTATQRLGEKFDVKPERIRNAKTK